MRRLEIRSEQVARDGIIAVLVVAGIVVGMALGLAPLASGSAIVALLVALAVPFAGLGILAFMAPLVAPSIVPAPGFDVALVAAILVGCIYRLPIDRPRLRLSPPVLLILAFTAFVTIQQAPEMLAAYNSLDDHDVGYLYVQWLAAVGAIMATAYLLRGRSPVPILAMALGGAALAAFIAIASNGSANVGLPLANLVAPSDDIGRATGSFSNPNYLGSYLGVMLVVAAGSLLAVRTTVLKALLVGEIVLLALALAVSLSRGGVVAAVAGIAVLLVMRGRPLAVALLGVGVVGAVLAYPLFVRWRLETLLGSASPYAYLVMDHSDGGRLAGILVAPALFLSSPLVGVGFGHFVPASVTVSETSVPFNAHNWYLTVLAEQGIVGVVLITLAIVATVIRVWSVPAVPRAIAYGVLGSLATASFFLEPPTSFQMLAAPVIIVVAAVVGDWRAFGRASDAGTPEASTRRPALGAA